MQATLLPDSARSTGTWSIYALVDPRTQAVRYVGKSLDPKRRLKDHLTPGLLARRSQKNSWLKGLLKAGYEPELEILESDLADGEVDEAEVSWIACHRWFGSPLTNGTNGGDGGAITDPDAKARMGHRVKHTEAARAKQSATHKARMTEAERERLRSISNGKPPPAPMGEANPQSRFTEADVVAMRQEHAAGATLGGLAANYTTSKAQISYVVTGKTWKHVGGPIRPVIQKKKLTDVDEREIRRLAAMGVRQAPLAEQFGVSVSTISVLLRTPK